MASLSTLGEGVGHRLFRREWWPGWLAGAALTLLYLLTLQRDIAGSTHPYLFDVGEMQIALNLWGTLHTTGYPLYAIIGALLVAFQKMLGTNPAAAASGVSLLWGVASLGVIYALFAHRTERPWLAGALVLVLGVMQSSWLYSVVAEVYTLYFLFVGLILWHALRDEAAWTRRDWLRLAVLLGVGGGHHRGVMFLVPALAIYLWPRFWQARREMPVTLGLGALLAAATILVYLYMPLRAWMGGRWIYGDPATWDGFWFIFFSGEAGWIARPPANLSELAANAAQVAGLLADELTWPGLVAGLTSVVGLFFVPQRRRLAAALASSIAIICVLVTWLPEFVLYDVGLMPVPMLMLLACGEMARNLAKRREWVASVAGVASLVLAIALVWLNMPFIQRQAHDPSGRKLLTMLDQLDLQPDDTLTAPWGPRYFAMAYAREVTGELAAPPILDHNADFEVVFDRAGRLITPSESFYILPPSWWSERIGGEVYLRSVGASFVQIDDAPVLDAPTGEPVQLENGVTLLASEVEPLGESRYELTLYWQTADPPDLNYSVFVHLVDSNSGEVLGQADSYAPVSGWYPVTDWQPGEVVRDDYVVAARGGYDGPLTLRAGLYRQLEDGSFENFEALSQSLAR
jgi:hypothetical protein